MAALLESLLQKKVDAKEAVRWLRRRQGEDRSPCKTLAIERLQRQEFVPFLLNFLREQSSHALANGPATPAKTPSSRPIRTQGFSSERRGCRIGTGTGLRSTSRVQLFSPTPSLSPGSGTEGDISQGVLSGVSAMSSPSFSSGWSPGSRAPPSERRSAQRPSLGDFMLSPPEVQGHPSQRRGRRRSSGTAAHQGRQSGGRGRSDDVGRRSAGGVGGKMNTSLSPTTVQLNFNNLEDFPPVGASTPSPVLIKPSRRINPTPVSGERPLSKPKTCFTSTPFRDPSIPATISGGIEAATQVTGGLHGLEEERELLRREKSKIAQQACSPLKPVPEPCTPTKPGAKPRASPDLQVTPDPSKVTFIPELDLLAQLYCVCISENLVPNVFLELFFLLQLLTSRTQPVAEKEEEGLQVTDVLESHYLGSLHNCVYFAVKVLENQFELVCHLDKGTLRLLAENERLGSFSPSLRERLTQAQETSTAKVAPTLPPFMQSVSFQPATDNRSNFSSDKAFHTFKKQRDVFYELLREWEDNHQEPGWEFERVLGRKVREMVSQMSVAGNHPHFARLFQKQLVQMCKTQQVTGSPGDAPDPDLLGILGADSLGRLKRLQERLIQPQGLTGPCPPPSFPGHQEFFRDFLQTAGSCQLNQHLTDSLCQQLLQLDEVSILDLGGTEEEGESEGDMEQQDEKQRFSSVLLTARLLAKFLGFITFLPYQTTEPPAREVQEAAIAMRNKRCTVLDVCAVLRRSVCRRRMVLTVPWLVEFLSMLDFCGPFLQCYRTALGMLLHIYRRLALAQRGYMSYLNQLLLVAVLGWLFQIPVFPEDLFFRSDFEVEMLVVEDGATAQGLDGLPLVDQQILYTCCPYLSEFRKLLAAFVAGSMAKSGGLIRKITPTSAEPRGPPAVRSQQKLQAELEQAFFHNQPPSLRRTVEFVAERVGSNCVKHIKATLVLELVQSGEKMLREKLGADDTAAAALKLSDAVCAQLCDAGMQALKRATSASCGFYSFCSEKGPEAIRILLPEETSPAVLSTSEHVTVRLATEKACSWLSSNIAALIKREWKNAFQRVMKTHPSSPAAQGEAVLAWEQPPLHGADPKKDMVSHCPVGCAHKASLPSDIIIEMKEALSIAVGPRYEGEHLSHRELEYLLLRVGKTLSCRKFLTPVSEQMILHCSVLLACKLVCGELPLTAQLAVPEPDETSEQSISPVCALLQQLVGLWRRDPCPPTPCHTLFTETVITKVLSAGETNWHDFKFLARQLLESRLLSEETLSRWENLSKLPWPFDSMKKIEELASVLSALSLQSRQDTMHCPE
ncbi:codanin-1 isoform X2 [Brienomyrus brachyistius]|uniref:codanin-1 isoform X2 n=1 Tax=Brienomyrus brachyistius TaxID=42636 RepID=UPI0020B31A11|nr:codanin-1 isoform X2 [Brienomyrus brachyistius]